MYFFFIVVVLSLSLSSYVDSYLLRFVQERRNTTSQRSAWINFFILSSMHVCVLPLTSTHFFLYILSIFPFFTPFCNRQMKVKKECIEYIRRFKDDEAKRHQESSTTFSFFFLFSFFYLSIFFALSSLTIHDSTLPSYIVCPNSSNSRFSSLYYYIVSYLFLYITPNIYNITSILFLPFFFLARSLIFSKKN
jgi:hypothetical protein